jgi:hypothetical protein
VRGRSSGGGATGRSGGGSALCLHRLPSIWPPGGVNVSKGSNNGLGQVPLLSFPFSFFPFSFSPCMSLFSYFLS